MEKILSCEVLLYFQNNPCLFKVQILYDLFESCFPYPTGYTIHTSDITLM